MVVAKALVAREKVGRSEEVTEVSMVVVGKKKEGEVKGEKIRRWRNAVTKVYWWPSTR